MVSSEFSTNNKKAWIDPDLHHAAGAGVGNIDNIALILDILWPP